MLDVWSDGRTSGRPSTGLGESRGNARRGRAGRCGRTTRRARATARGAVLVDPTCKTAGGVRSVRTSRWHFGARRWLALRVGWPSTLDGVDDPNDVAGGTRRWTSDLRLWWRCHIVESPGSGAARPVTTGCVSTLSDLPCKAGRSADRESAPNDGGCRQADRRRRARPIGGPGATAQRHAARSLRGDHRGPVDGAAEPDDDTTSRSAAA